MKNNINRVKLRRHQKGSTLLEVVVSMFVLAFGLLSMIGIQLKTQSSIRESFYTSVVAEATESLVEGMLANVTLQERNQAVSIKKFDNYKITDPNKPISCASNSGATQSQKQMACAQLKRFENSIKEQILNASVRMQVCSNVTVKKANLPTKFEEVEPFLNCDNLVTNSSTDTDAVIRVVWYFSDANIKDQNDAGDLLINKDKNDTRIIYTYQLKVVQ